MKRTSALISLGRIVVTMRWGNIAQPDNFEETDMWTKPEVTEMRFGFEVTMYVCNR